MSERIKHDYIKVCKQIEYIRNSVLACVYIHKYMGDDRHQGEINMNMEYKVTFYGDIIRNLKNELDLLTTKIQKIRDNNDFGTYKNLILAYKEVLLLYQGLVDEKEEKQEVININNTFKFDENVKVKINKNKDKKEEYELKKRMCQYYVNYGTLYKYMFKCVENENIEVIFYGQHKGKFQQFENIIKEEEFQNIFKEYLNKVTLGKDNFEIRLHNGSRIRFIVANDNSRGCRYHYAVVDTNIDREIYDNVVIAKGVLFEMAKRENKLSDNYNMEFIEM